MIKTTHAALVALLMAGAALPAVAQTMQPTTQAAQDQTPPLTPEQTAPATPDRTTPDQTKSTDAAKPMHVRKVHHLRHRHKMKAVAQAKANAGDTPAADPVRTTSDGSGPH